jgi:hypothetical protein
MFELLLTILILGLCSYRITRFLVLDSLIGMGTTETYDASTKQTVQVPNSPLGAVVYSLCYKEDGTDKGFFRGKLGDLLGCWYCLGFWVSAGCLAAWTQTLPWSAEDPGKWVLTAFAVAGVQIFAQSREG